MTIKAPAVPVVVECKYCGIGPLYWAQSEQGWILLSVVPGTLYTVIDATLTRAPTVYRRHFCDPLARTEWQVRQAEAQRVDDVNVARDMAYVEQERRDNEAYLNTPEGAKDRAIVNQSRNERAATALRVDCRKCRVKSGEPCVRAYAVGAEWDRDFGDYLKFPHNERITEALNRR